MPFWICYLNERFDPVARRRYPASIHVIVSTKGSLDRINFNVIKVQNNVSRVFKQRLVRSFRKLTTKQYNWERQLFIFMTISYLRYYRTRLPRLNPVQSCFHLYVMRILFLVHIFEYRYFHCRLQSLIGPCIQHSP